MKALFAITAVVAAFSAALVAGPQTAAAPIFTAQQAAAGRSEYARQCASCHMADLSGNVEYPPLAGKAFMDTWGSRSTKELFDYMSAAMPYGAPSLSADSYAAITAYILQSNGGVAGADTLGPLTSVPIRSVALATNNDAR